jgi:hypothetical protein
MTATDRDKAETGKTPGIRDLQKDEIDSVSGGAGSKTTTWIDPDTEPVASPKTPGWIEPDINPKR